MSRHYAGRQACSYKTLLRAFTERTLSEAIAMLDFCALRLVVMREGRSPRMLDVARGTGLFLNRALEREPSIDAYGINGSAGMLEQARVALSRNPHAQIQRIVVGVSKMAKLPFASVTFDLIACTNALHAMPHPLETFVEWKRLLAPVGYVVLEDIARREPPSIVLQKIGKKAPGLVGG